MKRITKKYEYKGKVVTATNKEEANRKMGHPLSTSDLRMIKVVSA